jgi:hypothetical protein
MTSGPNRADDDTLSMVLGPAEVPESIRCLDTLASPDYVDLCTAMTTGAADQSAEEWARATLEETPTGRSAPVLWRLLGLRLAPTPSPDCVQGWTIAARGEDWIRLETHSWFLTAHAVVQLDDEHVSVALFVHYDRPIAALIWPPVSAMHRRGVPLMLRQALTAHASRSTDAAGTP